MKITNRKEYEADQAARQALAKIITGEKQEGGYRQHSKGQNYRMVEIAKSITIQSERDPVDSRMSEWLEMGEKIIEPIYEDTSYVGVPLRVLKEHIVDKGTVFEHKVYVVQCKDAGGFITSVRADDPLLGC